MPRAIESSPPGLLLVGHGTRDPAGQREFAAVAQAITARLPGVAVEACHLELCDPNIDLAVQRLAAHGVSRLIAVPALLLAGGHVRTDIPTAVSRAVARHPGLSFQMARHLGSQPDLIALSAQRFADAERLSAGERSESSTLPLWVMIGRGGGDPAAVEEFHQFVAKRARATPVARVLTGFLAGQRPDLHEVLASAAESPEALVVVQPHLLFAGGLVRQVRQATLTQSGRSPRQAWRLAAHLGPAEQVIAMILKNYQAHVDIATPADSA